MITEEAKYLLLWRGSPLSPGGISSNGVIFTKKQALDRLTSDRYGDRLEDVCVYELTPRKLVEVISREFK